MLNKPRYLCSLFEAVLHDPLTMTIAATAASAVGSIQQGNAQAASFKSQAAADDYNAGIARTNADQANKVGTQQELSTREKNAQTLGTERAAVGEAGIGGPQGGTIAGVLEQDSVNAELDALGVRYGRDTKAAAYTDESNMDTFNASVARKNASSARTSGFVGALSSVLGGANKYMNNQTALANASAPSNIGIATPYVSPTMGPYDNSLPWRNTPAGSF